MLYIINNNVLIKECFYLHKIKDHLNISVKYCLYQIWDTIDWLFRTQGGGNQVWQALVQIASGNDSRTALPPQNL